jgi:hypothetical protein
MTTIASRADIRTDVARNNGTLRPDARNLRKVLAANGVPALYIDQVTGSRYARRVYLDISLPAVAVEDVADVLRAQWVDAAARIRVSGHMITVEMADYFRITRPLPPAPAGLSLAAWASLVAAAAGYSAHGLLPYAGADGREQVLDLEARGWAYCTEPDSSVAYLFYAATEDGLAVARAALEG